MSREAKRAARRQHRKNIADAIRAAALIEDYETGGMIAERENFDLCPVCCARKTRGKAVGVLVIRNDVVFKICQACTKRHVTFHVGDKPPYQFEDLLPFDRRGLIYRTLM